MTSSCPPRRVPRRRPAGLAVAAAVAATVAGLVGWRLLVLVPWAVSRSSVGPAGPLLAVACLAATVVLGWLCLTALATAACGAAACLTLARPQDSDARELCAWLALAISPRLLRPLLASVLAGTVALGTAAAANATATPADTPPRVSTRVVPSDPAAGSTGGEARRDRPVLPDPGWAPTSAVGSPSAALLAPTWTPQRPAAPRRDHVDVSGVAAVPTRSQEAAPVVVRRGDTLWSIAARQLGAGATDADVAREWPRWWRANRTTVGADPDLLHPGQVLTPPAPAGTR